jgi:acyl dehydratase
MIGAKLARLRALPPIETHQRFERRDTILYALGIGIGLGREPDRAELRYLLEDRLEAFPTFATMLAYPGFWFDRPELGLDWRSILLQAQYLEVHAPLPVEGEVIGTSRVTGVLDRGVARGALIAVERTIRDARSGDSLATTTSLIALRGDGESKVEESEGTLPERLTTIPPDLVLRQGIVPTFAGQPLLYRLSGDLNPLHADPVVARAAGLARPIKHGLCTFGVIARPLVAGLCDGKPGCLRSLAAEFRHPVTPGEELEVAWSEPVSGLSRYEAKGAAGVVMRRGTVRTSRP